MMLLLLVILFLLLQAFGGNTNGTSQNPKDRWGYWLTRIDAKNFCI
jgi:hypothetical protein